MRNSVKIISFLLIICPALIRAVGLGEIKVNSALNQPFSADVPIVDIGNIPLNEISAKLATNEEFEHTGIERPADASLFNFKVQRDDHSNPIIHISTDKSINEPIVNILLSLSAPEGHLLREYTVFLDPPDYVQAVIAGNTNTVSSRKIMQPRAPFAAVTTTSSPVSKPLSLPSTSKTYHVKANDRVWSIAKKFNPPGISRYQVMLAIITENPHAFTAQNVNGLKNNAILTIPSKKKMQAVSPQQARQILQQQDKAWKGKEIQTDYTVESASKIPQEILANKGIAIPPVSEPPFSQQPEEAVKTLQQQAEPISPAAVETQQQQAEPVSQKAAETQQQQAEPASQEAAETQQQQEEPVPQAAVETQQPPEEASQNIEVDKEATPASLPSKPKLLRLTTKQQGAETAINNSAKQPDKLEQDVKQLSTELTPAKEALNNSLYTNSTLPENVKELQQQNQQLQPAEHAQELLAPSEPAVPEKAADKLQQPSAQEQDTPPINHPAAKISAETPPAETVTLQAQSQLIHKNSSWFHWVKRIIGFILLGITGAIFFVIYKKFRQREKNLVDVIKQKSRKRIVPLAHMIGNQFETDKKSQTIGNAPQPTTTNTNIQVEQSESKLKSEEDEQQLVPIRMEDIDILEEVDVYVAYGRYAQAMDGLQQAINTQPHRLDLVVKMLEVQVAAKDQAGFNQTLTRLPTDLSTKDPVLWEKVQELKKYSISPQDYSNNNVAPVKEQFSEKDSQPIAVSVHEKSQSNVLEFEAANTTKKTQDELEKKQEPLSKDDNYVLEFSYKNAAKSTPASGMSDEAAVTKQAKESEVKPSGESEVNVLENLVEQADKGGEQQDASIIIDGGEEASKENIAIAEQAIATKFDLAQVYIDMADYDEAQLLLDQIIKIGKPQYQQRAQEMLSKINRKAST